MTRTGLMECVAEDIQADHVSNIEKKFWVYYFLVAVQREYQTLNNGNQARKACSLTVFIEKRKGTILLY